MLRELRTLVVVAREGTFAAAAQRVGLTQAAVSAQMARLQAELGFPLFDRVGRVARLNARGQQVLLQAGELIRLHERLGAAADEPRRGALVTVGAIASVQRSLLPDALARFHRQHPGCRSRIVPGVSLALLDQVDAGELDIALLIRPPHALHGDLRWTTLVREPFRLIVPRQAPPHGWERLLAELPFIRYDRASFGGRHVERFLRARQLEVDEIAEADELEAIVKLVANGVGAALVPETARPGRWPAAVRALDLGRHTFHREIGLVHRPAPQLGDAARALAAIIGESAR